SRFRFAHIFVHCFADPSIVQTTFTFLLGCTRYGAEQFVQAFPAISCVSDHAYHRLYPLMVIIALIVCGAPIALFIRLYWLKRNDELQKDRPLKILYDFDFISFDTLCSLKLGV